MKSLVNILRSLRSLLLNSWLKRARAKNSLLKQEHAAELSRAIQPTPFANKSVTQLKKLARRGHRRGWEAQSKIAEAELRRRLMIGRLVQP